MSDIDLRMREAEEKIARHDAIVERFMELMASVDNKLDRFIALETEHSYTKRDLDALHAAQRVTTQNINNLTVKVRPLLYCWIFVKWLTLTCTGASIIALAAVEVPKFIH